ncbi:MAG: hypothetical protein K6U12_13200 [Armatimonadetes bacterium]|nr:hypothetical protein [Armatimonadota bacterium]CUU38210.1 hypothetical protein DCOP10_123215 [Armatimonadetes bacterium DC]
MSLWYNQSVPQIRSVEELIQIIRQHPEWREALLSALLPQDLLLLPQEFRAFRAEMRERMEAYEKRIEAHERRMEAIEEQIARQRAEFEQQMQQMRLEFQQQLQQLRLEFQQQMQAMRAEFTARFEQIELEMHQMRTEFTARFEQIELEMHQTRTEFTARFERVEQDIETLKKDMKEVKDDLASVKGIVLEIDWERRAKSFFGRLLRHVRVYAPGEFYDREIEKRVALESSKRDQLLELDYVIQGVRRSDGKEIVLAVEVSWGVGVKDISRARERAAILRECGYLAVPVAIGRAATPKARTLAGREGVVLITDSKVQGEELLKQA